ncbi:MAG: LamG domain-containing protein [Pirellulales bacterium]
MTSIRKTFGCALLGSFSAAVLLVCPTAAWADYMSEILADGPIGYWRFEEAAGAAVDSSGNSRDGAYMNGVTPGLFPGALSIGGKSAAFDGSTGFVDLPGSWGGAAMTEISLEAWVNPADPITGDFQAILSGHDPNSFAHFQLHSGGNMGVYADVGFVAAPIVSATPTDTWRHVVMTAKSGETKVYVNGTQVGATVPTAFANIAESSNVDIGIGHLGARWFNGLLDEVAIYDSALSPERIMAHYDAAGGTPPPPPPAAALLAHYAFDTDADDATGNHPGSLQGGAAITSLASDARVGSGALDLRGVDGFVDIPTPVLDHVGSFSISMFVSVDALAAGCCTALVTNDSWAAGKLHLNLGSTAIPEAAINGNPTSAWGQDVAVPTDGSWVHLAYTYDAATGVMTPYINGVAGNPGTGGTATAVGDGPLNIGAWDSTGGGTQQRFLDGRIDDLRFYSGVLTPAEVSNLAAIPEPSTFVLLGIGLLGLTTRVRRTKPQSILA